MSEALLGRLAGVTTPPLWPAHREAPELLLANHVVCFQELVCLLPGLIMLAIGVTIITQFTPYECEKRVVVFMKAKWECLRKSW